ncbi:MAG: hypothetical protein R6U85_00850, partial [Salinivirgaceae bacterium]
IIQLQNCSGINCQIMTITIGSLTQHGVMASELVKRNTRRYARKQLSWFRRNKSTQWFKPEMETEIIEFIQSKL